MTETAKALNAASLSSPGRAEALVAPMPPHLVSQGAAVVGKAVPVGAAGGLKRFHGRI